MVVIRGPGGQVDVSDREDRKLGIVITPDPPVVNTEDLAKDETVQELVDQNAPFHLLWDYGDRIDDQPVFVGKAPAGAALTSAVWRVLKVRYESSAVNARVVESDMRLGVTWANRSAPENHALPAWTF